VIVPFGTPFGITSDPPGSRWYNVFHATFFSLPVLSGGYVKAEEASGKMPGVSVETLLPDRSPRRVESKAP
jgi:hypothetical protein